MIDGEKLGKKIKELEGESAWRKQAEEHRGDIHLLLTDVVMPEMNGRELMEKLHAVRPGMKSLFMSGYTANVMAHRGVLDEGVHFIRKPFSMNDLAAKVREVMGE